MKREDIAMLLCKAGVRPGMSLMVHSSLSGLGYLPNGPYDVIDALRDTLGPDGTLLAPTHSGQLTDPSGWTNPPVPAEWVEPIRRAMEPFDSVLTPVRNRGLLPEYLLRIPGVRRSIHPLNSTAALGAKAEYFTSTHPLDETEGIGSPCHKLYEAGGYVLLLGVGVESCTALYVADFLADAPHLYRSDVRVLARGPSGEKEFHKLRRYPIALRDPAKLLPVFAEANAITETTISDYKLSLLALAPAIDAMLARFRENPAWLD